MERAYVEQLSIKNYGCIKDATLTLSPLHALIGPNDSGKTTFLNALGTMARDAGSAAETWDKNKLDRAMKASAARGEVYLEAVTSDGRGFLVSSRVGLAGFSIEDALRGTLLLRLDPDALRKPCP